MPLGGSLPDLDEYFLSLSRMHDDLWAICWKNNLQTQIGGPKVYSYQGESNWRRFVVERLKKIEPDVVHLFSYRGSFLLPLMYRRTKWIFDIRSAVVSNSPWRRSLGNNFNRFQALFFERRVAIFEGLAKKVYKGLDKKKVFILPLGADFNRFKPLDDGNQRRILRGQLGYSPEDIVIIYVGSLSASRQPVGILRLAERFRHHEKVKWLVIGHGSEERTFKQEKEKGGLTNVQFLGVVPYDSTHKYYQIADIGFAYVPTVDFYMDQPPLKTIEMLASGLPILGTATNGNRLFVKDGFNGRLCQWSTAELAIGLSDMLRQLPKYKSNTLHDRKNKMEYHWDNIVKSKLLEYYRTVYEQE